MIPRREYMYELSVVLMALGDDDVNQGNASVVANYFSSKMLQGIVNNTIEHGESGGNGIPSRGTVIGWSPWWVEACRKELEERVDKLLLE